MKRILPYIIVLILSLIPFSFVVGEPITHNFNEMYNASPKQLVLATPSYKSATTTTDDLTYTISGSTEAKFWLDLHYSSVISVNLPSMNDSVIVASPSEAVRQVWILFYPSSTYEQLKVYASADGTSYGGELDAEYVDGRVIANLPSGSHYLKVKNTGKTSISIYQMEYRIENCNCFRYVPE